MRQWTVDAFASRPFLGNPACMVEPFDDWPDDAWMLALARENNQAETAFLVRTDQPDRFLLRWFTPDAEVPLCGHATLGSGHVLFHEFELKAEAVTFETRQSGRLIVRRRGFSEYEMDFPALPPKRVRAPDALAAALGAEPDEVWAGHYGVAVFGSAETVRSLRPDTRALEKIVLDAAESRGNLVVAAPSDDPAFDVVDRFFCPGSSVEEDPATGSAHCILAPLFADKLGKPLVKFFQAFPGRGAEITTELREDRVRIIGRAETVIESRLRLRPHPNAFRAQLAAV
jgi:PhzF family phenazine biosynthesis protein